VRAFLSRGVRYRITGGGLLFLAALAMTGTGAFLTGNNLLFLIFSAMLALLLVSGFLGRLVLSGLELELLLPRHVAARAPSEARIRLRNVKRLSPSFSIELSGRRDPLTGFPPILSKPVYFPVLPGGSVLEAQVEVTFPWRGRQRENLFVLSTRFPFGFLSREAVIPITRDTLVYPAIDPGANGEALLDTLEGQLQANHRGPGQDFYRIRPWEPSDGARLVDWKSTAHTGELQAREFAREEQAAVEIILDRRIPKGAEEEFERIIEECAWLVWMLEDLDTGFELYCDGESVADSGGADVHAALRFLALVQPVVSMRASEPLPESMDSSRARVALSAWN
jgi:uncharacterized protein (DUF58 family)